MSRRIVYRLIFWAFALYLLVVIGVMVGAAVVKAIR